MAFTDEFSAGALNAGWTEIDPANAATVTVTGGNLHWVSAPGYTDMTTYGKVDAARLVQSSAGDFDVTFDAGRDPGNKFDGIGMYVDDGTVNNFRCTSVYFDEAWTLPVAMGISQVAGEASGVRLDTPDAASSGLGRYQRLKLQGTTLTFYLSTNGTAWNQWWSTQWSGGIFQRVGIVVLQDRPTTWDIAYFRSAGVSAPAPEAPTAGQANGRFRVNEQWSTSTTRTRVGGAWKPAPSVVAPPVVGLATTSLAENSNYLENPNIGYQGWTHDIGSILPTNTEYRRGNHAEQGKFSWNLINTAQGVYDWSSIDAMLAAAAARGEQASFRIMTMLGETFGGHLVPQWVINAGATLQANGEPDYRTRAYRQHWGTFVDALRVRYDGDPRIAFIDIGAYGQFGEWFAQPYTDHADQTLTANSTDSNCRRHFIHMHTGGTGTGLVLEANGTTGTMTYTHTGFQQTQLVMPYGGMWATTRYVLTNYPHVGWRNDALLGADATYDKMMLIGNGIEQRWKTAPVVFEPLNTGGSTAAFAEGTNTMRGMGASMFHDNGGAWTAEQLRPFVLRLGYRYWCRQVSSPGSVAANAVLPITTDWTNTGYAKAYPRMGQNFAVTVALANASGTIVASATGTKNVSDWLPGVAQTETVELTAPAAGTYTRLVGIVNRNGGTRIHLPVATARTDKWYPAGTITVA